MRISWDEATDLIAAEIKRIHEKYGPLAILVQGDGHGECKMVHAPHGCSTLLLDKMGGFTQQVRNPDSWEGWYWGSKHVWGKGLIGMMNPADNIVNDISENSDMVVVWGGDPETTTWGFRGQFASRLLYFWSEIGIKQVYICPDLNYAAAIHADKWIPILPNTDAALQLAIMYMWITEGTYDKEYVETHTVGFDKMKAYVLGEEDGVAKTPEWARRSAASRRGPSRPWPATGPRRPSPSATTSAAAWPAARTPPSRPASRSSCSACRAWASRASTRRRSPTPGMPKNVITGGADHMGPFANLTTTPGRRAPAQAAPGHSDRLGQADDPQDPHRRGHPATAQWTSGAPAATRSRPPTSTGSTPTRSPRKRAAPSST